MSEELLERSDLESETVAAREAKQERDISFPKTDRIYHMVATDNMQQELVLYTSSYCCHQRWHWSVECQPNIATDVPTKHY